MLSLIFRLAIGSVLIYAGFVKAVAPSAEFAAMIAAYKILPAKMIPALAIALPYVEMWVGLFVLTGLFSSTAPLAATGLFGMFLIALSSALLRGIDLVSCGCFGADSLSPKTTLGMDFGFLVLSLILYKMQQFPQPMTLDDFLS